MRAARACIYCSQPLLADRRDEQGRISCCVCGLVYSVELVEQADTERWERARIGRLYRRDGDTLWMTDPLQAIRTWAT